MQDLKIGFDAKRLFLNFTGLGNYSRSLVSGLSNFYPENQYYLFSPKIKVNQDTKEFLNQPFFIEQPLYIPGNLWRMAGCTFRIKKLKLDIYHGLSHELPLGIKKTKVKSVVTIHDLIYKTFPDDFSVIDRKIYDFKFRYACENADRIIAVSESTKKDLIRLYHLPAEKIKVIYQSCHNNFKINLSKEQIDKTLSHYGLPEKFMLYVGSVIERKNLLTLVKAIDKVRDQLNIPLVVVGKGKTYLLKVKAYVDSKKLQKYILFAPAVAFHDLPALYQKASLFIYPSLYEGFGIPVIEALWSKTPVITSDVSSLPEAAGPGAYYCNPNDYNLIAEGLLKIIHNDAYAKKLADDGYNYVQRFNPEPISRSLKELYIDLIK